MPSKIYANPGNRVANWLRFHVVQRLKYHERILQAAQDKKTCAEKVCAVARAVAELDWEDVELERFQHFESEFLRTQTGFAVPKLMRLVGEASPDSVSEKMVEYCAGIVKQFDKKVAYINFITDVSENCDCYDHNSEPIVPDIGILASFDPVAIDQASVDLVNKAEGRIKGNDKLKTIWPSINWEIQLKYAEEIGLGSRKYELL
ncbi:DUF362 domain-containing protein [Candidatus Margulisiibacteriota bacterium]